MTNKTSFPWAAIGFIATTACHAVISGAQSPIDEVSAEEIEWVVLSANLENHGSVDRHGDPLPDGAIQRLGTIRYRQTEYGARHVSFLGDSRTLLAYGDNGQPATLVDALTGRAESKIAWKSPLLRLSSAATSSNGRFLTVVAFAFEQESRAYRPICKLWDVLNRQVVASCSWDTDAFSLVDASTVSNDGTRVAIGGDRGQLYLWQVGQPEPEIVQLAERSFDQLRFTSDDDLLIARGSRSVYAWSMQEQKLKFQLDGFSGTSAMVISSDNRLLAIGDRELAGSSLWNLENGKRLRLLKANHKPNYTRGTGVAFSSDGTQLIMTIPERGVLEVFDVATGKHLQTSPNDGVLPCMLAVSPDCKLLAGTVGQTALRVWTTDDLQDLTAELVGHTAPPLAIEYSKDGEKIISSCDNGVIIVWSVKSGQPIHRLQAEVEMGGTGSITTLALSPDGTQLLSNGFGVGLDLWDLETGDNIYHLARHASTGMYGAHACGFSADGTKFFSFGPQFYFRAWERRTGKAMLEERPFPQGSEVELDENGDIKNGDNDPFAVLNMEGRGSPSIQASFLSDDGKTLAYIAGQLCFVDTSSGKTLRNVHLGANDNVLLTSDLGTAAVASRRDGTISIRNTVDGTEAHKIVTNVNSLRPHCFSQDGSLLAVTLHERTDAGQSRSWLAIYNTQTGKQLFYIEREELTAVRCANFSPDNTQLAISQANSSILLLDLEHFRVAAD